MSDFDEDMERASAAPRRALLLALLLNVGLAVGLAITGLIADSSALIANALDNTSDAGVYAISFYAAVRGLLWKARAAQFSGVMLLVFAVGILVDVTRRFFGAPEPLGLLIMVMAVIAAAINILSLKVLHTHRSGDVNFRAAWTFSVNDLIANLGVLLAGLLVIWLDRAWPDLMVGLAIAAVAAKGGMEILVDGRRTQLKATHAKKRYDD